MSLNKFEVTERNPKLFDGDFEVPIVNNSRTMKLDKDYKAKENKAMKRRVPFTSVSVDPEIQRM